MVFKELDRLDWEDPSAFAWRMAGGQMPYYLRRYFGDSDEVDVLNQLCVSTGGVVTQVDHLLMHPFGLIVVDSSSVSARLQVKEDGRWICVQHDQPRQVPSPVTHAYAQALSLKAFLEKKVHQKGFFDKLALDVLVAVPDTEVIEWPSTGALVEVCSADAVPGRVSQRVAQYRSMGSGRGLLIPEQRRRLAEFLCFKHKPGTGQRN